MSIQRKSTERIELVETNNIALSIRRLRDLRPYDSEAWKRALYHALLLNNESRSLITAIRVALELP